MVPQTGGQGQPSCRSCHCLVRCGFAAPTVDYDVAADIPSPRSVKTLRGNVFDARAHRDWRPATYATRSTHRPIARKIVLTCIPPDTVTAQACIEPSAILLRYRLTALDAHLDRHGAHARTTMTNWPWSTPQHRTSVSTRRRYVPFLPWFRSRCPQPVAQPASAWGARQAPSPISPALPLSPAYRGPVGGVLTVPVSDPDRRCGSRGQHVDRDSAICIQVTITHEIVSPAF